MLALWCAPERISLGPSRSGRSAISTTASSAIAMQPASAQKTKAKAYAAVGEAPPGAT